MKRIVIFLSIGFFIVFFGLFFLISQFLPDVVPILNKFPEVKTQNKQTIDDDKIDAGNSEQDIIESLSSVIIDSPDFNNPLDTKFVLKGSAPGVWFRDGVLTINLLDANGKKIAVSYAKGEGIWTTGSQVNFVAEFEYYRPNTETGSIVFVDGENRNQDIISIKFR